MAQSPVLFNSKLVFGLQGSQDSGAMLYELDTLEMFAAFGQSSGSDVSDLYVFGSRLVYAADSGSGREPMTCTTSGTC